MEITALIARVMQSPTYAAWQKQHAKAFLAHVLCIEGDGDASCQVGFYDPVTDEATTFSIDDEVLEEGTDKIFKQDGDEVRTLDTEKVQLDLNDGKAVAEAVRRKKYQGEIVMKTITVLQRLKIGQVYNITFVTQSFKTLNIKIDAATGSVLHDSLHSLISVE